MKLDFTSIEKILGIADIDFSASFTHGLLTAFSCRGFNETSWVTILVNELDPDDKNQKEALNKLKSIKEQVETSLKDEEMSFSLVIDDENNIISDESESTRDWASGFWLGIQKNHLAETLSKEDELEFFDDLQKISLMPITDEQTQETQNDLFEIQEYLRAGAISTYLSSWKDSL